MQSNTILDAALGGFFMPKIRWKEGTLVDNKEILKALANTHNALLQIPVCGDNAILMATALTNLRGLTQALSSEAKNDG